MAALRPQIGALLKFPLQICAAWLLPGVAAAYGQDAIISSYIPDEDCVVVTQTDALIEYRCPGVFGIDVWFSIGDVRWTVSFHSERPTGLVLNQGFDRAHHPDLQVEWRFDGNRPMAALQRWRFYDADGELDEGAWVITRIAGDEVCHMGFVDVVANEEAVALARRFADANAKSYSCADDPQWIGNPSGIPGHTHRSFR